MTAPHSGARPGESAPVYHEPARSYVTSMLLFGGLCIGLLIDVLAGGALVHIWGWLAAIVVVVGFSVLVTSTARRLRSITVTADEVRVGSAALARDSIVRVGGDMDGAVPVLGQAMHEGLSRGVAGLAVVLSDGAVVALPSRHPARLAAALHLAAAADELPQVRPAEPADLSELSDIDRRASTLYRVSGLDLPELGFPVDELHDAKAIFVAGRPAVGFVRVDEADGQAYIDRLAVIPSAMRRGTGTALLDAACAWARETGYLKITTIAYADVAWNAPFLKARGFAELSDVSPEIAELRDWERAVGLDGLGRRVVLQRAV